MPCGGCGGKGKQIVPIATRMKEPHPGILLRDDAEKQAVNRTFNITSDSAAKITRFNDNAYCAKCGQIWLSVPVPHYHTCSNSPSGNEIEIERNLICIRCEHNEDNTCMKMKQMYPERECSVPKGNALLRSYCPDGKWLPIEYKCPSCGSFTQSQRGVKSCRRCGEFVGHIAASKKNNRTDVPAISEEDKQRIRDNLSSARYRRSPARASKGGSFRFNGGTPEFKSLGDMNKDALRLVSKLPPDTGLIIGIARSGLSVATMVSMLTHKPLLAYQQTLGKIVETGNGWRLGGRSHVPPGGGRVVVIDDTVMTGNSFLSSLPVIKEKYPDAISAALYVNPTAKFKPDVWVQDLPWPHLLEWNMFNSVLSPNMALDFDGVLCHDCPPEQDDDGEGYRRFIIQSQPKYLPRKSIVPLIVTARIEKYRALTMDWLQRHGVTCKNLVMHPASTLAERRRDDIAAYKARHYAQWASSYTAKPPPHIFVESDDRQAQRISSLASRRIVVCPSSARCYGDK